MDLVEPGFGEDVGGVVGDDVDAAELLHEHDDDGGEGGAAVTWDGEELKEEVTASLDLFFSFEEDVDVWKRDID